MSRDRRGSRFAREESRAWFELLAKMGPENEQVMWNMVRRIAKRDVRRELGQVGDRVAQLDGAGMTGEEALDKVLAILANTKVRPTALNGR